MKFAYGLAPGVRRFAAVGLLAAVVAGLFGGALPHVARWAHRSTEDLADARFELMRARAVSHADEALSISKIEEAEGELSPYLLTGATESEASGNLHAVVDGLLRSERLTVESAQPTPTVPAGALSAIGLDWRGSGTEADVVHAVAALEHARPLLKIERLTLRSIDGGAAPAKDTAPSRLTAELRVVGLWAAPPHAPAPREVAR